MNKFHIHFFKFHHRSGANVYTQCRCGKRKYHSLKYGYSPINWKWINYDN